MPQPEPTARIIRGDCLKAPFPYFGGKSRCADLIWQRFGAVRNYVEPFAGSLAVLLSRPEPWAGTETVNDADGFISNFWRATAADPEAVAHAADWPVNENDLHARHAWLVGQRDSLQARLEGDPTWFDAKIAGWWCWGICCWIGSGWCSGKGPWQVVDGALIDSRKLVHLGDAGQGVNRKLVHLGNAGQDEERGPGCEPQAGGGISRKRPLITNDSVGVANKSDIYSWFAALSARLARVRVCCGDWTRVCGPTPTVKQGLTAVFLDPPYAAAAKRDSDLYRIDCEQVANAVRDWAVEHGDDPRMRICLAGYEGEHRMPKRWAVVPWKAKGGYASQSLKHDNLNAARERLWFSPHCVKPTIARRRIKAAQQAAAVAVA